MLSEDDKRLRAAGRLPQETRDYLDSRKASKLPIAALGGLIIFLIVLVSLVLEKKTRGTTKDSSVHTQTITANISTSTVSVLQRCNVQDAEDVLTSARKMFSVTEDSDETTYVAKSDWWVTLKPKTDEMINAIANADACSRKTARRLVFRDPQGHEIGSANPSQGIKVNGK